MAPDLALDADVQINAPLTERLACFMHDLASELLKAVCNRLVVPTVYSKRALRIVLHLLPGIGKKNIFFG